MATAKKGRVLRIARAARPKARDMPIKKENKSLLQYTNCERQRRKEKREKEGVEIEIER